MLREAGLIEEAFADELGDDLLHLFLVAAPGVELVAHFLLAALLAGAIRTGFGEEFSS